MESFDKIQYTVLLRKEFYYPQYKHDDWTVYIPVYGSFHCTFNGKTDRILPGEVYVIPPDVPFDRGVDQPLSVQFIRFRENEASPWPFPIPTGAFWNTTEQRNKSPSFSAIAILSFPAISLIL